LLVDLIKKYGVEKRVEILGRVNEGVKRELLRTCLFLVMPSRFEGWGIAAIEANAACKAVLGTDIPGMSEALIVDKTAILVNPDETELLSQKMDDLINMNELRIKLGKEGRKRVKRYSWESIAKCQYSFYKSIREKI